MALVSKTSKKKETTRVAAKKTVAPKKTTGSDAIKLPTKPNEPPAKLTDYIIALYGEKGIGKTSLCAEFPSALTFMFEPRRRNLKIKQVPQQGEASLDWSRYCEYIDLVCADTKVQSVAVDTIDRCYEACFDYICQDRHNVKHPQDKGRDGYAVWEEIKKEFERVQFQLFEAEKCVIFVSHAREQEIISRTGEAFNQIVPTCTPTAWKFMKACCDFAFYYGYHGRERAITVRGDELIWSAAGVSESYLDPDTQEQLSLIPAGTSPTEAYKNLQAGFNNKLHGVIFETEEEDEDE